MKNKAWLLGGLTLAVGLLAGCKSNQEAAGDKFRKAGDHINALMQYEEALRRGNLSKEFWDNYALVNIKAMELRSKEDATAEFLDILKDTVASLLKQHPNPQNEAIFAQTLFDIGMLRTQMGGRAEETGLSFFKTAASLPGIPQDIAAKITQAIEGVVAKSLKDIKDELNNNEETSGIVADYKMAELSLKVGSVTPEMQTLWSEIRKKNLSTYLMYDLQGLLPEVDARINKYALLLGIVKYEHPGNQVKVQVKIFNGGSLPIKFDGDGFRLYDKEGNAYAPKSKLGAATKKDIVGVRDESKTGGVNFTLPDGAVPDYLEFTAENMKTRKYLP